MGAGPIRALTGGRRTKPTSTGCRRLRQPEPGRRSPYQAGEPVQTKRASSLDTRMTRPYARAARGERAAGKVPRGRWERLAVLGALVLDGLVASRGVAAATGTAVFLAFAEEVLIPAL